MLPFSVVEKASNDLSKAMQIAYVSSVISQDAIYFDKYGSGEIATRATTDLDTIDKGYGQHLGWLIWLACYVVAVSFTIAPRYRRSGS
jgi:ABC-type multidrug transport system fused ATPase/permease subunit